MKRHGIILGILVAYLFWGAMMGMMGIADEAFGISCGNVRRVELLFPGYRVGRWLGTELSWGARPAVPRNQAQEPALGKSQKKSNREN